MSSNGTKTWFLTGMVTILAGIVLSVVGGWANNVTEQIREHDKKIAEMAVMLEYFHGDSPNEFRL